MWSFTRYRLAAAVMVLSLLLCAYSTVMTVVLPSGSGYVFFQPLSSPRQYTGAEVIAYTQPAPILDIAGFRIQESISVHYTWTDGRIFVVPWWFLAMAWAIAPAVWLRRRLRAIRHRRRVLRGLCAACGYDLRATPSRCPECGRVSGA